jgi:hypothetical protein
MHQNDTLRRLLIFGWLTLGTPTLAAAQSQTQSPAGVENKISIENLEGSQRITFWLRKEGGNWVKHSIGPSKKKQFPCGDQCFFCLTTKQNPLVERKLRRGKHYTVYWNKDRDAWEMGEITELGP